MSLKTLIDDYFMSLNRLSSNFHSFPCFVCVGGIGSGLANVGGEWGSPPSDPCPPMEACPPHEENL